MSIQKFRLVDLTIWLFIGLIALGVNVLAFRVFGPLMYIIDLSLIVVFITMFRWGIYGGVLGIVLTGINVWLFEGSLNHYVIYLLGSIMLVGNIIWFLVIPKQKIKKDVSIVFLFVITGYLLVIIGRLIAIVLLGLDVQDALFTYIFDEGINVVIVSIAFYLVSRQDNILVDMFDYVKEIKASEVLKDEYYNK